MSDARATALRALSQFLIAETSLGDTLLRISEISTSAMPAAEMAGLTMLDEKGRPTTAIFTDPESPEMDAAQYESGSGPCLDAWRQQRVVRTDDMAAEAAEAAYPDFSRMALRHGVHSTLSLPLMAAGDGLGALNMYSRQAGGFSEEDEAVGVDLATAAAVVLANATAYWDVWELSEQLTEAMRSRATIEQAKGILMARSPGINAEEAFEVLRRASQRENVKLREIAQRLVDRRSLTDSGESQTGS